VYAGRTVVGGRSVNASLTLRAGLTERTVEQRVRAALREKVALARVGLDGSAQAGRLTLATYGDTTWLADVKRRLEPSSHLTYTIQWERHVRGTPPCRLATMRLVDVRGQHVRDWLTALEQAGRKSGTLDMAFGILLAIFKQARADHPGAFANLTAIEDVAPRIRPRHELPRRVFPTPAQIGRLFAVLGTTTPAGWQDNDPPFGAIVHVVYFTAKRISEVLGLRWGDWDEIDGGVFVRGQQDHHTRLLREYPKQDRHQYLKLPAEAVAVLTAHRAAELAAGKTCRADEQIFTDEGGDPLHHPRVWRAYKDALERAGLPPFRLHDLRGAFAMAARRGGMDDRTIAEQLGHANLSTLHRHYMDRSNPMQAEAADLAARAVRDASSSVTSSVSPEAGTGRARSKGRSGTRTTPA
jgi:integrase